MPAYAAKASDQRGAGQAETRRISGDLQEKADNSNGGFIVLGAIIEKLSGQTYYDYIEKNTFDDTPEEREAFYEKMWENGGFEFWLVRYTRQARMSVETYISAGKLQGLVI